MDERFRSALAALKDLQRSDFEGIFREMSGLPVTIRLLDPPLHEFLPVEYFEQEQPESAQLVRELQEANPMLGTRGVRLAVLYPPIYEMQVRAIVEAAAAVAARGEQPEVEIMVPLIAYETELEQVRERIVRAADEALERAGREVPYLIGTMLELPRACLVADRIALHADFLSFGTNDLTQTAIGLSRDDVEAKFLGRYVSDGIIDRSPFETIDEPGVGELVAVGTKRGREGKPGLKIGVCGEHGGTRTRSRSSTGSGSTTSAARPTGCRSRGWPRRSPPPRPNRNPDPTARFEGMATEATATFEDRVRSWEDEYLWDPATRSYPALRDEPEPDSPVRTPFQRDRDRIVHSKAFRRLKHKTQVFVAPEGDHYRTRLTHTLEACIISRTVARALGLNEDLTEAVGLGHDLGHPPFGHIGEEVLDEALGGTAVASATTSTRCASSR